MKKKLLTLFALGFGIFSFGQFTTGTVSLTANRTIKIDTDATTVTLTLTGSSTAWLGIGFGGTSMSSVSDMFIWNSTVNNDYTPSGGQSTPSADSAGSQSWTITSDTVTGTVRTIEASRPLTSAGDYTFLNDNTAISTIYAEGSSTALAYHGQNPHSSKILQRTALGVEDFSLNASTVYPNPSNGSFMVQTKTNLDTIDIYSQSGQFVKTINVSDKSSKVEVQVKDLSTGIYLIELKNDSEKSWKKVIVE